MKRLAIALFLAMPMFAQTSRIASDFELAQMEKQLATSRGFEAQLSGRLNLGDVRVARNEISIAHAEYAKALDLAQNERRDARVDSNLTRYAIATSYAGLAYAKLDRPADAMKMLEEALRYASDDPETWSLYASAMRLLGKPQKAVSAARNAVAVVDPAKKLDVAVYKHALATSLLEAGEEREAQSLLVTITESLRSSDFATLQREAANAEVFEVYSSARGDVAAYVSLLNRAQLRLAALYEKQGDTTKARTQYERVLEGRSDDVTAIAALARLAPSDATRERLYIDAFEANPFSLPLIREYRTYVRTHPRTSGGTPMQRALQQLERGNTRAARETLDALLAKFPQNETLRALRREAESAKSIALPSATPTASELRALLDAFERLTPEQRVTLDETTFTSDVTFDGEAGATFASGAIDGVAFRFSQPTTFAGTFEAKSRLTYRILGVTRDAERDVLLLEPVRVEPSP
ncbi:MAG TPA: tetratricopeptide repeat protein [Thermoanaerobaculia bacterium]